MAGSHDNEGEEDAPLTPRTRATRNYFARLLNEHTKDIIAVVNETREALNNNTTTIIALDARILQLEQAQSFAVTPSRTSPAAADASTAANNRRRRHTPAAPGSEEDEEEQNANDYVADTEQDDVVNTNSGHEHQRPRHNRQGMRQPRQVRDHDDPLLKIKFSIPSFAGKYDADAYLTWEMAIGQKFECYDIPDDKRIRAATSEFTDFACIWWQEHYRTSRDVPTT